MASEQARYRVLVVGESTENHSLVAGYFEGSDVRIENAASTEEGLGAIDSRVPDLVVVDAEGVSGLELCRLLKANPDTVHLPVLVLADSPERKMESFGAGTDEFMIRTVGREEFLVRVNALLRVGSSRRTHAAAQLAAEVKHREEILNTFRRYVSPKLADRIMDNTGPRRAALVEYNTRARATVLFADMRGFTRIAEQLNPSEVVPLLNEYFSLLTEITFLHEGTVFNMAGDSLMVGFGVPLEQTDATVRAVKTAADMLAGFRELAADWNERHGIETGIGIGINEGDVIVGNIGSHAYMNYTIIGDVVNVAARLCQRARSGEILFSEAVKRSLDAAAFDVGAMELPPLVLRGRSGPVNIFCVPVDGRLDTRSA